VRHEPAPAVHVPHPGIDELDLDDGAGAVAGDVHLDLVGQVEAALGLDGVPEHASHVLVLLGQLQLAVGLEVLEVLGAHESTLCPGPAGGAFAAMTCGDAVSGRAFP
jgi:hypothetical protein